MADKIDYDIYGDDMQPVEIVVDPGGGVRAEAEAMACMETGIEMQTSTDGGNILACLLGDDKRS